MRWKLVAGRCIYQSPSQIKVFDNGLFRWLTFGKTDIQTLIYKKKPHLQGLDYIPLFTAMAIAQPGSTCLLGLGGGGVLHRIRAQIGDAAPIEVVELNPEVIGIAYQYFKLQTLAAITVISENATHYIQSCNKLYAHLLVDLFGAEQFPNDCLTIDFFSQCKRCLLPKGILAINLANRREHQTVFHWIRQLFGTTTLVLPVKKSNNLIILAFNQAANEFIAELKTTQLFTKIVWDANWRLMGYD